MGARRYASGEAVCEETVVLTRLDKDVPIGAIDVPSGSTLSGKTSVSLLDCSPVVTNGSLSLLISLYVQEELYLTTPQGASFLWPLAFVCRNWLHWQIADIWLLEDNLDCHIISLAGTDHLTLHDDGTFDQLLEIRIQVKLVADHKLP